MLIELPTLSDRVLNGKVWEFRAPRLSSDRFLDAEACRITLFADSDLAAPPKRREYEFPCEIEFDGRETLSGRAAFQKRGRWRPTIPMGRLNLYLHGATYTYHLITQQVPYYNKTPKSDFSDLSPAELHQGELLNFRVLHLISSAYLRAREVDVTITSRNRSKISAPAILVEEITNAQVDRGEKATRFDGLPIEASDLFNLHFCQALIGNSDYCFDYNEHSRFVTHNVSAYQDSGTLVPFPFDLQFSCILTPNYQRHRNFSIQEEAKVNASAIAQMTKRLPREVRLDHLRSSLDVMNDEIQRVELTERLRARFGSYLGTFRESLNEIIT